ncbi:tRNA (adenosine(37)-N6)-dimethylallyltransferase MiaA [Buchnera aphidicola]|uniref:tRNA dimethylallyltransferase n=1 Tax=Buchnera aphidicola subsp. Tuberolachnus salignus TaxID=98804 RepID=A0A170PCB1_BUCTT|nr:tRNA (adenosine(37)-N6)-dimethylallyltransferase MiaA [Buchnera aphidicola]CUR53349.1 tRNA dimethylallyltransferase [Buchnera aphidicola (Tuberolachnus salignus)]
MKIKPIIFFLMGPTAIGKSFLSIQLKKKFSNLEIISVDSKLVYRGLDIGTDKPNSKLLKIIPHHLINICNPSEIYSVAQFRKDALKSIRQIILQNKVPFLVGGTMLYFKILLEGLSKLPASNIKIRSYIFYVLCHGKIDLLYQRLKIYDPIMCHKIHFHDTNRILRVLEVCYITGQKFSDLIKSRKKSFPYKVFQFGLFPRNKKELFKKIIMRFEYMLKNGLEREVKNLFLKKNLNLSLPSINSIGYKQMWLYLQKKITYQKMYDSTIQSTKKLVKHQLTWLKKWKNLISIQVNTLEQTKNFLNILFKKYL